MAPVPKKKHPRSRSARRRSGKSKVGKILNRAIVAFNKTRKSS